jgi:hypothetical protein
MIPVMNAKLGRARPLNAPAIASMSMGKRIK